MKTTTEKLCAELHQRREMGLNKHGTTLSDAKLSQRQLLQHAKEEALDMAEYLQALIDKLDAAPEWPEKSGGNMEFTHLTGEARKAGVYEA